MDESYTMKRDSIKCVQWISRGSREWSQCEMVGRENKCMDRMDWVKMDRDEYGCCFRLELKWMMKENIAGASVQTRESSKQTIICLCPWRMRRFERVVSVWRRRGVLCFRKPHGIE